GKALGERAQPRGQEGDAEAVRSANADGAGNVVAFSGDLGSRGDHVGLNALGDGEEAFALLGQLRTSGEAAKQFCAEAFLKRCDPARDGRVVELEPPRGTKDLTGPRHGEEYTNVVPVHRHLTSGIAADHVPRRKEI